MTSARTTSQPRQRKTAAAKRPTNLTTPRLTEVARYVRRPEGIDHTGWPSVEAKCLEWGVKFDLWQAGLGRLVLGKRTDDKYAATVGGITLMIPRQVAKTFIVGRIVMALCALFPGLKVLWTAHHTATLTNTFQSLSGFARRKSVAAYIGDPATGSSGIKRGSGKEAILFLNGSSIRFGARDQGWGRGFEEIDVEVFDEAQILNAKALEDMVAATNQTTHPHGALLFYMGTPPRPTDPGATFMGKRAKAIKGLPEGATSGVLTGGNAVYVECSADPNIGQPGGPSLDDHKQWRKANPSFPDRTPLESMERLRENLVTDDAWRREAMGVCDQIDIGANLDSRGWAMLVLGADEEPTVTLQAFALDVDPKGLHSCIAGSGLNEDGRVYVDPTFDEVDGVQVLDNRAGNAWVPDRLQSLVKDNPDVPWVVLARSQADVLFSAFLEDDLHAEVVRVLAADWPGYCATFMDRIEHRGIVHTGTKDLQDAVEAAVLVAVGEEQVRYGRRKSTGNISPLVAGTLAGVTVFRGVQYDPMSNIL